MVCVLFVVRWRHRVECVVSLVHAHTLLKTKKKKLHLLDEDRRRDEREVCYIWYQSGFDPRLGIAMDFH
jgi:hypothetical protein